jgi:hypothetical protein
MPAKAPVPVEAFPRADRFRGMAPSYKGGGCATRGGTDHVFVGAGHARESAGSG